MCQDKGVTRKCPPFFDLVPSTVQRQSKKSFHVSDCFKNIVSKSSSKYMLTEKCWKKIFLMLENF